MRIILNTTRTQGITIIITRALLIKVEGQVIIHIIIMLINQLTRIIPIKITVEGKILTQKDSTITKEEKIKKIKRILIMINGII